MAAAGLRLFAERGFGAVSVGDIEQAVGLVPRRGALYRHFASKADLLAAAVEEHLDSVGRAREQFESPADGEPTEADDLARWVLAEMDRQRLITQVLERDGERLPELRDRFRADISDTGYAAMAAILRGWMAQPSSASDLDDPVAVAILLLGALVNARRSTWTMGAAPLAVDDERLVTAWATLCEVVVAAQR